MSPDIRTTLRKGAPAPQDSPDVDAIVRGGTRLRARRYAAVAMGAVVVVAVAAAVVVPRVGPATLQAPAGPGPDSEPLRPERGRNGSIAFVRSVNATEGEPALELESAIVATGPDGSATRVVEGGDPWTPPAWSPDGSTLAFVDDEGIALLEVAAGHRTTVISCRQACGQPAWSPDGSRLAFAPTQEGADGLWMVNVDGSNLVELRGGITITGRAPAWSPDGGTIAVAVEGDQPDGSGQRILLLDAASGATTDEIEPEESGFIEGLSWSPDALTLAFAAHSPAGEGGIYLAPMPAGEPRLLTSCAEGGCSDTFPAYSPDGEQVAFTRARCSEPGGDCSFGDIMVIDLDGGRPTSVTTGPDLDCCPAWQPLPRD